MNRIEITTLYFYPVTGEWTMPIPDSTPTGVNFIPICSNLVAALWATKQFVSLRYGSDESGEYVQFSTEIPF